MDGASQDTLRSLQSTRAEVQTLQTKVQALEGHHEASSGGAGALADRLATVEGRAESNRTELGDLKAKVPTLSNQVLDLGSKVTTLEAMLGAGGRYVDRSEVATAVDGLRAELGAKIAGMGSGAADGASAASEVQRLKVALAEQAAAMEDKVNKFAASLKRELDERSIDAVTMGRVNEAATAIVEQHVARVREAMATQDAQLEKAMHASLNASMGIMKNEVVKEVLSQLHKD